jgi:HSP20 family protein
MKMSISRWEPFGQLVSLRDAMNLLFEESYLRPGSERTVRGGEQVAALPVDVYETAGELVVMASIPGVDPGSVEITLEGDTLSIRGEGKLAQAEGNYLLQERRSGPFLRQLQINIPVQADKAEAAFDRGVLTLTIPKSEAIKPRQIKVKSGS